MGKEALPDCFEGLEFGWLSDLADARTRIIVRLQRGSGLLSEKCLHQEIKVIEQGYRRFSIYPAMIVSVVYVYFFCCMTKSKAFDCEAFAYLWYRWIKSEGAMCGYAVDAFSHSLLYKQSKARFPAAVGAHKGC